MPHLIIQGSMDATHSAKVGAFFVPSSVTPSEAKAALRKPALARLASEPVTPDESLAIQERILALPEFIAAKVVSLFIALPGEPACDLLWERAGHKPGLTLVCPGMGATGPELRRVRSVLEMRRTQRGFFEPPAGAPVDPATVDLFVVPGLAFDAAGLRLGRGGGYYDRLLAQRRAGSVVIGVLPERFLAASLPREPHDVAMTHLVTEARLLVP